MPHSDDILDEKYIYCKHIIKSASAISNDSNAQIKMKEVRAEKLDGIFQDYQKRPLPLHRA